MGTCYGIHTAEYLLKFIAPARIINEAVDTYFYFLHGISPGIRLLNQFLNKLCFTTFQHFGNAVQNLAPVKCRPVAPPTKSRTGSQHSIPKIFS